MRFQVQVEDPLEDPFRDLARAEHRSPREHASYLLNLKIREELARRARTTPEPASEAVGLTG
jgi:hypothetical protein